ncbi:hypothetical protein SCALM49S_00048 [Streptomyces californicus]
MEKNGLEDAFAVTATARCLVRAETLGDTDVARLRLGGERLRRGVEAGSMEVGLRAGAAEAARQSSRRASARVSAAGSGTAASSSASSLASLDRMTGAARTAVFCRLNSSAPSAAESVTAYGLPLAMKSETTLEMSDTMASDSVEAVVQPYLGSGDDLVLPPARGAPVGRVPLVPQPDRLGFAGTSATESRARSASSPPVPPPSASSASRAPMRLSSAPAAARSPWSAAASAPSADRRLAGASASSIIATMRRCAAPAWALRVPVKGCGL